MKIKISKDKFDHQYYLEIGDRFFIEFVNRWYWLFHSCNWFDVELIAITFEKDSMLDGYELVFIILGIGFRARLNTFTKDNEIIKRAKDVEDGQKTDKKK